MGQLNRTLFLARVGAYVSDESADETALRLAAHEGVRMTWGRLPQEALQGVAEVRSPDAEGLVDVTDGRLLMAYVVMGGRRVLARQTDPDPEVTEPFSPYGSPTTARGMEAAFYVSRGQLRFVLPQPFREATASHGKLQERVLVAPYPDLFAEDPDAFGADYLPPNLLDAVGAATAMVYLRDRVARLSRTLPVVSFSDLAARRPAPPKVDWQRVEEVLPEATVVGSIPPPPSFEGPAYEGPPLELGALRGPDGPPALEAPPALVLPSSEDFRRFLTDEDPRMAEVSLGKMAQDLAGERARLEAYQNELARFQAFYQSRLETWRTLHLEAAPSRFSVEAEANLAKYREDIQQAAAVWGARVEGYRASVQIAITDAQLAAERAGALAQIATEAAFRNEAERVAALLADYEQRLRAFELDVASYRALVETELSGIELGVRRTQEEARMLVFDLGRAQTAFEEALVRAEREAIVARPIRPAFHPF